jgi:carboxy-terminal domain RNA polymerase II polypeptide A small phosphatase
LASQKEKIEKLNDILIVLDIDETLIHATSKEVTDFDHELLGYKIIIRPFLQDFLALIKSHFRVAVWSSATDDYVNAVVASIFPVGYPLEFVWGRGKCTFRPDYKQAEEAGYFDYANHYNYIKRLTKVKKAGYATLEKTLIIDDTPAKCIENFGNAIYPSEFKGNRADNELLLLGQYLLTLKGCTNVRPIEKRFWRKQVANS